MPSQGSNSSQPPNSQQPRKLNGKANPYILYSEYANSDAMVEEQELPSALHPTSKPVDDTSRVSEEQFLRDLSQLLLSASKGHSLDKITRAQQLVGARQAWVRASDAYLQSREELMTNAQMGKQQAYSHKRWGNESCSRNQMKVSLDALPDDILFAIVLRLDGPSLCVFQATCRNVNMLVKRFEQTFWRAMCTRQWGIPSTNELQSNPLSPTTHPSVIVPVYPSQPSSHPEHSTRPSARSLVPVSSTPIQGYFLSPDPHWKSVYEERHNLYSGQYRFRMIADLSELDSRERRQALLEERKSTYARKNRKYILHCGQPTAAGSGYAVNLRLCGSYMCWIAGSSLAVCKFDSHSPVYLTGHTLPLVTLTTNQRNLVVTGAEDNTLRVWDLRTLSCVQIIEGVDVLDCAIHEDWLASYNNDNIIQVWHLGVGRRRQTLQVDVHSFDDIDGRVFTREVKIAIWGDRVVCGFENSVFMVICRHSGDLLHTLSEPVAHHREEYDSTHYPTVLALYDSILISRGVRCHELCVWDLVEGQLLYRLSESFSFQDIVGFPTRPNEVITDFTLDARGTFLMCTVENEAGDVYLLAWDFRKGGSKERERQFVKRSLEYVAGDWMQLEYKNYWLCYETS